MALRDSRVLCGAAQSTVKQPLFAGGRLRINVVVSVFSIKFDYGFGFGNQEQSARAFKIGA